MTLPTYIALIDYADGENQIEKFPTKAKALAFAREEIKWENTLHATVIEENEDSEIEIFSEQGEQA